MHCLYCFSNDNGSIEFVVISDLPEEEVIANYESELRGITVSGEPLPIDGDATAYPCDRELKREY